MGILSKYRYLIFSVVISVLLYFYITLFEEVLILLSLFPVALFALIYKKDHGKLPSFRKGLEAVAAAILLAGIGSIYYPVLVFAAITGFSVTGFFVLLYKLVEQK